MNALVSNAVMNWKATAGETIDFATPRSDDGELIELTWDRADGHRAYVELFPDSGDVVLVQYGTVAPDANRQQCGVTRFRVNDIPHALTKIKRDLDGPAMSKWSYEPTVEIGYVSSLKFR